MQKEKGLEDEGDKGLGGRITWKEMKQVLDIKKLRRAERGRKVSNKKRPATGWGGGLTPMGGGGGGWISKREKRCFSPGVVRRKGGKITEKDEA